MATCLVGTDLFSPSLIFTQQVETQEETKANIKRSRIEGHSPEKIQTETEAQASQKGRKETVLQQFPQENNEAPQSMEIPSGLSEENKEDENMEELDKTYVKLSHDDAPGKRKVK